MNTLFDLNDYTITYEQLYGGFSFKGNNFNSDIIVDKKGNVVPIEFGNPHIIALIKRKIKYLEYLEIQYENRGYLLNVKYNIRQMDVDYNFQLNCICGVEIEKDDCLYFVSERDDINEEIENNIANTTVICHKCGRKYQFIIDDEEGLSAKLIGERTKF